MSGFAHSDPADFTPDEIRHPYEGTLVWAAPCPGCKQKDGSVDTEHLDEEGTCVFGCGHRIDEDMKYCFTCKDHSANTFECEVCATRYEKWNGSWERIP